MQGVRVKSSARIACCLLDLNGELGRADGTFGFGLKRPFVEVVVTPASELEIVSIDCDVRSAINAGVDLASEILGSVPRLGVNVVGVIQPHAGLGHKTQTVLSVALACLRGSGDMTSPASLARLSGRGGTSGVGVHTFQFGGMVLDAGHRFGPGGKEDFRPSSTSEQTGVPPLIARIQPSDNLRVVLGLVADHPGVSGSGEVSFFSKNCPVSREEANAVISNVLMRLIPGLIEGDMSQISAGIEAIQNSEFKRAILQNQPRQVAAAFERLSRSCRNVGISSMGPTMYSIVHKQDSEKFVQAYRDAFEAASLDATAFATEFSVGGATVEPL